MNLNPLVSVCSFFLNGLTVYAQFMVSGTLVDQFSRAPLGQVMVSVKNESEQVFSDENGYFRIRSLENEPMELSCDLNGYKELRIPVSNSPEKKIIDLGPIGMTRIEELDQSDHYIELSQEQIDSNNEEAENISGILTVGKDLFSRTSAYDFGSNFFRPRLLSSEHGDVMLNGVIMNKVDSGRPEWGNWGGLNDALRLQVGYEAMTCSPYGLGGLAQGIDMVSRASEQREGLKLSLAHSNKNYQNRIMITYSSGLLNKGWAYMMSASIRLGEEGYRDGTNYNAYSVFTSVDKQINEKQSLNATLIYAYNNRGKSAPMTQEVLELKNGAYNSYWGYQQEKRRNSRGKTILEPIFQLNHYYEPSQKTSLHSHFTYQFGSIASSRLDYSGSRLLGDGQNFAGRGMNPDPSYYQKLPSYFLRDQSDPDYGRAYLSEWEFIEDGQIDWTQLYESNVNSVSGNSIYALYEDKRERQFWSVLTGFSTNLNDHFSLDGAISMCEDTSENYAWMKDLLGGNGFLDVDSFEEDFSRAQNNLKTLNRIVKEKEKFKYDYLLKYRELRTFLRLMYRTKRSDAFLGLEFISTQFQRYGLYENGAYPGSESIGKSEDSRFHLPGIKAGFSYKFSGRHLLSINGNYFSKPPLLNNAFSNVRVSNDLVIGVKPLIFGGIDIKYHWRHSYFDALLSGYYLTLKDASKVSFYYADGFSGLEDADTSAFVQQALTGIDKQNIGLEFSVEAPLVTNIKVKAVAAVGCSVFTSNPDLYLTSNTFEGPLQLGSSYMTGYRSTGGPQAAYSVGLEYSSPNFWWISTSLNFFENSYLSIAPITRTGNFFLDSDGAPIHNVDTDLSKNLLSQEELDPYVNLNIVGGKSWKINNTYLGLFLSLNNLTNEIYKTGGFEQSRNANYLLLKEDKLRSRPLFAPKYWISYGTTFFTSLYIRI